MSKKIGFLSVFNPFRGGIAQFSDALYLQLKDQCDLNAYNLKRQYPNLLFPGKTQYVEAENVIKEIKSQPLLDSVNPFSYLSTGRKIQKDQNEVVLSSYWMSFFAPSFGTALKKVKCKKIGILHNVIPHEHRFFDNALTKFYLNQNDEFVVLSDTVRRDLLQLKPNAVVHQIPHPVYDHFGELVDKKEAKEYLQIDPNKKVILFFGFIRKYKGLDLLIDALKGFEKDYCLLIAGESYEDYATITEKLTTAGIKGDNVKELVRYISEKEVKYIFSASDICALPYRSATQSGIAAVAKHFRVPMLVTPVGELPNEVSHMEDGFCTGEVSSKAIREGLEQIWDHLEEFSLKRLELNKENSFEQFGRKILTLA